MRAKSGSAASPAFFGCNPASTRTLKEPIWKKRELAPIPPSLFKSINFIRYVGRSETSGKNRRPVRKERALSRKSAARDDVNDLQPVTLLQPHVFAFARRHGLKIPLHDHQRRIETELVQKLV